MNRRLLTCSMFGVLLATGVVFFNPLHADATPAGIKTTYSLRLGHDMPEDSAQHVAAKKFAEVVGQRTQGRVQVDIFPAQQLGTDQQMIEAARRGELAIILPPTAKLSTLVPAMQLVDMPFLFPSREVCYELLSGKFGRILLEQLDSQGLIGVALWESGFKNFTANKKVTRPEDFKGLKIRTMKSPLLMDQIKALGAHPIPIDFHKTRQALKDGKVDGQENPLVSIVNMKFHEVQSHLMLSRHGYLGQVFAFSKKKFEILPKDIQDILRATAVELTYFQRTESIRREQRFLDTVRRQGVEVVDWSDEERTRFVEATKHLSSKLIHLMDAKTVNQLLAQLQEKNSSTGREIVIGLDADMTLGSAPSGIAIKRGMELAVEEINQAGGVLGRNLKIDTRNHQGISARGIQNMRHFSQQENLVAVMGGLHSPVALAEVDIIQAEKIIYLDPWAAATSIVDNGRDPNYVFRVSVRDSFAGDFLVDQALKKYKRVALLLENTGWGRGNHKSMSSALEKRGLAPVAVEWFNWSEKKFATLFDDIEKTNADVVILVANAPEGITVVKTMAQRKKQIPIISHWGITGGYFWENTNQELRNVDLRFLQTYSFLTANDDKARLLKNRYFKKYGTNKPGQIISPIGTAHAYDLVHLLANAIKQAGTIDRSQVRDALEAITSYHGLVKKYAPPFTKERHDALDASDYTLARYNIDGYIVPISD